MKKLFLSIALASAVAFANAQDMTSKKGVPILPESGDWSISFDAVPFLNYIGNAFNGNTNNTVFANWADTANLTIVGKLVRDNDMAYRGKIRIGFGSVTTSTFVASTDPNAAAGAQVKDETTFSQNNIVLGGGIQKSRGKGRLRGYYGAELLVGFGGSSKDYTYGNTLDANNPTSRTKSEDFGSNFMLGIRGLLGVEYFFAPKISIGAEYGWGLGLNSGGEGEMVTETWNGTAITTTTSKTGSTSTFGIDNDNAGGAIWMSFYF